MIGSKHNEHPIGYKIEDEQAASVMNYEWGPFALSVFTDHVWDYYFN